MPSAARGVGFGTAALGLLVFVVPTRADFLRPCPKVAMTQGNPPGLDHCTCSTPGWMSDPPRTLPTNPSLTPRALTNPSRTLRALTNPSLTLRALTNPSLTLRALEPNVVFVEVSDNEFIPSEVTIFAGDLVVWTWVGDFGHTVTSRALLPNGLPLFDSEIQGTGFLFTFLFEEPGDYLYYCIPHEAEGMVGVVHVLPQGVVVPEPAGMLLLSGGAAGLVGLGWRRRRSQPSGRREGEGLTER